ncbi:MAG: V-type ATP synthase subunit C [Clostridiaceae bacterium]|nr:V-type ATP synthase subunit C [Clostridiaceae bacterium]
MARIRQEDYAYAVARIRAIESKLLSQSRMERLLELSNPSDAAKLLIESGYGTDHTDNRDNYNFEALFSAEEKKVYDFLIEMIPDPLPVHLFMKRYDYLNAKLILKAEFLGVDISKSLSPMGTIKPERLLGYITDRKLNELPDILREAVLESLDSFSQTRDPQVIDLILDKASYKSMMADAKATGETFLVELVKRLIDAANIRIFVRSKILSMPKDFVKKALIAGGTISENQFDELSDQGTDKLFEILKSNGLESLASELSQALSRPEGLSEIEKILDDSIIRFMKGYKYVTLGIEPVIAYLFYKETEIKNARLIVTGLMNRISQEIIKERLRLGYA